MKNSAKKQVAEVIPLHQAYPFSTLKTLPQTVDACRVTTLNGGPLTLVDGLNRAVNMIQQVDERHRKIILIGNGGSAAIASHQAVDLWKNGGIRAQAFNDASLLTCVGNDYGYPELFSRPLEQFADPGDLLIAVSSSGKSPNILNGVESARKMGCGIIGFSGFHPDNPLSTTGDLNFYLGSDSYGVVEVGHLWLIHAITDEVISQKRRNGGAGNPL